MALINCISQKHSNKIVDSIISATLLFAFFFDIMNSLVLMSQLLFFFQLTFSLLTKLLSRCLNCRIWRQKNQSNKKKYIREILLIAHNNLYNCPLISLLLFPQKIKNHNAEIAREKEVGKQRIS